MRVSVSRDRNDSVLQPRRRSRRGSVGAVGATRAPGSPRIATDERQGNATVSRLDRVAFPGIRLRLGAEPWRHVRLAVVVWCQAAQLDRQLAAGTNPQRSPALRLRAQTITARRSRRRLAGGLGRALSNAEDIAPGFTAAVRTHHREVLAAGIVLEALRRRLCAPEPVTAQGVAILQVLLTDGTSLLYRTGEPGALGSHLRAAAAALGPTSRCD